MRGHHYPIPKKEEKENWPRIDEGSSRQFKRKMEMVQG
jgi:hypothetical protein